MWADVVEDALDGMVRRAARIGGSVAARGSAGGGSAIRPSGACVEGVAAGTGGASSARTICSGGGWGRGGVERGSAAAGGGGSAIRCKHEENWVLGACVFLISLLFVFCLSYFHNLGVNLVF